MDNARILRTGLPERLEQLRREFPACSWLKDMAEMN